MKTLFAISPTYLHALYAEVKKYSFHLQGYGNFKDACHGILRVNSNDLLGMVYLSDELPLQGSTEYKHLCKFLHLCDLLEDSKKLVFISKNVQYLKKLAGKLQKLRITFVPLDDFVTDSLINKSAFGGILLDTTTPYDIKNSGVMQKTVTQPEILHHLRDINYNIINCIQPVNRARTLEDTVEIDEVLRNYTEAGDTAMVLLRKKMIYKEFGADTVRLDSMLENLLKDIQNDESWCALNAIYRGLC